MQGEPIRAAATALEAPLFDIGGTPVTISTLMVFLVVVAGAYLLSRLTRRALGRVLEARGIRDVGAAAAMSRLIHYGVMGLGVAVGMATAGINLSALFAAGAIFAVALGFAMQDLGANLAAGITLLVERTITPGDILEVEGRVVRVESMGIRSTIGTTLDDKDVIIPNSALVKSTVVNYTLRDELVRVRVSVAVRPDADLRRVREVLEATAAAAEWRSRTSDPVVLLADLARTGPVWEVSVFVDDPWRLRTHAARLREAIWWALADAGIELAGPPAPPAPVVPPAGAA